MVKTHGFPVKIFPKKNQSIDSQEKWRPAPILTAEKNPKAREEIPGSGWLGVLGDGPMEAANGSGKL